jgi:hypothetical protein
MSWSEDYKKSIDCSNPKGFSQKAHCDGRKARQRGEKTKSKSPFKEQDMKLQEVELFLEENCPTDPSKWSYYKSQAKKKFDVYPSAYANAWAAKQYKGVGGGWKKCPKKESIDESTLSQIHNAAKKGSYPVTLVAIEDGFKVVSQEIVKTPMAVPAAFRMMQGAHPRAKIHVEDKTGKILFREFQRDRQLRNPSKEMMVVKDGEVVVIDKKDWKKYKSKGYMVAESVNEATTKKIVIKKSELGKYDGTTDMLNRAWQEFVLRYVKQNNIKFKNLSDAEYIVKKTFKIPSPDNRYDEDSARYLMNNGILALIESVKDSSRTDEASKIKMNNLDWGKSTAERNANLDKYDLLKTDKEREAFLRKLKGESVNEAVKKGKKYGDWTVTQYEPVEYDDYGAPNGGRIKIVNQQTGNDLLIQNDLALRGSKWYISVNRRTIKDTNPEKVIQQAIKSSVNEGKITKTFKFPRKTSTDIDEIDADFSRQGIQSNPDFNNNTVTVTGDENKIKKIVKFHRGIEESLNTNSLKKIHDSISKFLKTKKGVEIQDYSDFPNKYGDNVSTYYVKYDIEDKFNYKKQEIKIDYSTSRVFIPNKGYFSFKTVNDIKNIINKKTTLKESVNERYRPNLESKGWEAAQKVIRQLQSSVFRKLDDDELLEFRKAIADAFNLDGVLKETTINESRSGMDIIRRIVKNHQYESGVDVQTANMILNAYNKVDSKTQKFMDHSTLKQLVDLFMRARKR